MTIAKPILDEFHLYAEIQEDLLRHCAQRLQLDIFDAQ